EMWKVVVLAFFCAAAATPAAAQIKSQIQKVDDQFSEAFNKGDAASVADHYTEDATALPPGSEMVKGKAAILEFWTKTVKQLTDPRSGGEHKERTCFLAPRGQYKAGRLAVDEPLANRVRSGRKQP